MIKGKISFSSNQHLDREYAEFIDKFIEFSGESSVIGRKDDDKKWKEHEAFSERSYNIVTVFSEEEVEFLSKEYPHRFKKLLDATIQHIGNVKVIAESQKDKKLEVKVEILDHCISEANLRIAQDDLVYAGAMKRKGSIKKAESWLNENKDFILEEIHEQFPSFWELATKSMQ